MYATSDNKCYVILDFNIFYYTLFCSFCTISCYQKYSTSSFLWQLYRKNFSAHAHRAADARQPMSAARRSLVTLPTLCRGLCAACGAFCRCNLAAPSVYTHDAFSLASSRLERCIVTIHPSPLLLSLLKTLHAL